MVNLNTILSDLKILSDLFDLSDIQSFISLASFDIDQLDFDEFTNSYSGTLSISSSNSFGLNLDRFGGSLSSGDITPSPSVNISVDFWFTKYTSRSIVDVLQNYLGFNDKTVLFDILVELTGYSDEKLFLQLLSSFRYHLPLEIFVSKYNILYPQNAITSVIQFEDFDLACSQLYAIIFSNGFDYSLFKNFIHQVYFDIDISSSASQNSVSDLAYDTLLDLSFGSVLGFNCSRLSRLRLHIYYKIIVKANISLGISPDYFVAIGNNGYENVSCSVSSADLVLSNYVPSSLSTGQWISLTLVPEVNQYYIPIIDFYIRDLAGIYLDISPEVNIPGLNALGLPPSTMGVYIEHATLSGLPLNLTGAPNNGVVFKFDGLFLGTNGFSGLITIDTTNSSGTLLKLGSDGLGVEFDSFSVLFRSNRPISSQVKGELNLSMLGISDGLPFEFDWYDNGSYTLSIKYLEQRQASFTILGIEFLLNFTFNDLLIHYYKDYTLSNPTQKLELSSSGSIIIGSSSEVLKKFFSETKIDYWTRFDSLGNIDGDISIGVGLSKTKPTYRHEFKDGIKFDFGKNVKLLVGPLALEVGFPELNLSSPSLDIFSHINTSDFSLTIIPPSYLAVEIDFSSVKGSGIVYQKNNFQRFEGLLVLTLYDKITISALAIYSDQDGQRSFIGLVSVEGFAPIPIGLGFQIVGLGGILGVNRRYDNDYIVAGLTTGSIDKILFPKSDIKSLAGILGTVENAFPTQNNNYVFGLSARITWGEKVGNAYVFTSKLALVFSFPTPVIIALLGTGQVLLPPTSGEPVAKINFAFAGAYNTALGLISFDARLYDSKIQIIRLEGQYIVRILVGANGEQPDFLMSAGGYHPSYVPPLKLRAPAQVKRISMVIANIDGLNISTESYFAISSNVVMFGNRANLSASFGGASINGHFAFDTIVRFSPFQFLVDFSAGVDVRYGGRSLASLTVGGQISGPNPWHAHGYLEFEIFWIKFRSGFSFTWPRTVDTPSIAQLPEYGTELKKQLNVRSNYGTTLLPSSTLKIGTSKTDYVSRKEYLFLEPDGYMQFKQVSAPLRVLIPQKGTNKATFLLVKEVSANFTYPTSGNSSTSTVLFSFNLDITALPTQAVTVAGNTTTERYIDRDKVANLIVNPAANGQELKSYFITSIVTNSGNDVPTSIRQAGNTYIEQISGCKLTPAGATACIFGAVTNKTLNYSFEFYGDNMQIIWPVVETPGPGLSASGPGPVFSGDPLEEIPAIGIGDGEGDGAMIINAPENGSGSGQSTPSTEWHWSELQTWLTEASTNAEQEEQHVSGVLELGTRVLRKSKQYKVVSKTNHASIATVGNTVVGYTGSFTQVINHLEIIRQTNPALYQQLTYIRD